MENSISLKHRCPIHQMKINIKTYDPIMMIISQHKGSSLFCWKKSENKKFFKRNSIIKDYGRLGQKTKYGSKRQNYPWNFFFFALSSQL